MQELLPWLAPQPRRLVSIPPAPAIVLVRLVVMWRKRPSISLAVLRLRFAI
jgi:hypothetical protein